MERFLGRVSPILHLTRVTTAFAAVANVWFVILWSVRNPAEAPSHSLDPHPLPLLLLGGTASALGLYSYGACLNDLLDVRRDRALRPERPLPSGRITTETAAITVAVSLLLSVLGAAVFGIPSVLLTLALAAGILFFNAAARFVPGVGLVVLGLLYAGHMLVPNLGLRFLWPVWLVMSHSLLVAAVTHVLARKVPPLSTRAVFLAVLGWLSWSILILGVGWMRSGEADQGFRAAWPAWVPPTAALGPAVLAVAFVFLAARRIRQFGFGPRAADKIYRYGSLWLTLYAVGWMLGSGFPREAAVLGILAAVGFLTMTTLRELYGLAEQPVGYRR
ncbi:MAG: hypothetical protein IT431_02610 [Phycisphaerales bacterium]|nr:hypothetical protein [Phycisphaerales bacterium]